MDYRTSPDFDKKYKKIRNNNVRLANAIDKTIEKFYKNPTDSELDNHPLKRELEGLRVIHIVGYRTNDYCAVYEEITAENGYTYAYFHNFGRHKDLFRP